MATARRVSGESPSADAITNCLRTTRNTLSVWFINNFTELEEAVLAIAAQFDHLDTVDFLIIELSMLYAVHLEIEETPGETPYTAFISSHRDITALNYVSLGTVADVIVETLRRKYQERFTRGRLKNLLYKRIEDGKIQKDALKKRTKKKLFPEDVE